MAIVINTRHFKQDFVLISMHFRDFSFSERKNLLEKQFFLVVSPGLVVVHQQLKVFRFPFAQLECFGNRFGVGL